MKNILFLGIFLSVYWKIGVMYFDKKINKIHLFNVKQYKL
jgi:hypothetical protein